jgi:prophage antirepressor-like protein
MDIQAIDQQLSQLTRHQLKIVQALYDAGEAWLTRSQVARALGKKRLTPYDIECLQMLTEVNILETSTQPTTAPGSDFAYIYHMSDEVANALQVWAEANESKQDDAPKRKPINLQ